MASGGRTLARITEEEVRGAALAGPRIVGTQLSARKKKAPACSARTAPSTAPVPKRRVMPDTALQKFFLDSGLEPERESTPKGVRRTLAEEVERWTPVIKGLGLQVD